MIMLRFLGKLVGYGLIFISLFSALAGPAKSDPPKPEKCVRGTDWLAHNGRDDELPMTDLQPDGTLNSLDCYTVGWSLGAELPSTGVTGSGIWDNPQFESPGCDPRSDGDADADITCSLSAGGLTPDGLEVPAEDEDRLKLELNIYEGEEFGDVDLKWPEGYGVVVEWTIPFSR